VLCRVVGVVSPALRELLRLLAADGVVSAMVAFLGLLGWEVVSM
jgi:hypothetical protein